MKRCFIAVAIVLACLSAARAAELDGVTLPDTQFADGKQLRLNGIGLRTYSVFRIHIYVAGLYLEHPSDDAAAILHSTSMKMLAIRFVHDVSVDEARTAWRNGFQNNCVAPCQLDPHAVEEFLAAVRPIVSGDEATLLFTPSGAEIKTNGELMGRITDKPFAELILATFIGPAPATPRLKRELLGERD